MPSWSEIQAEAPDLAAAAREFLDSRLNETRTKLIVEWWTPGGGLHRTER